MLNQIATGETMRNKDAETKEPNAKSISLQLDEAADKDFVDEILHQWGDKIRDKSFHHIFFRIVRIAQYFNELEDKLRAEPVHLTLNEFRILMALMRSGRNGKLTPSELKKNLLVSFGAISKQLERLEAKGYIERKMDTEDRRSINVSLTPAGMELVASITSDAEREPSGIVEGLLRDEELKALEHLLRKILLAMERKSDEFLKQRKP